ncbi:MAG: ParB N-terminal domain-containing protein [Gammaproteobacteria bacterium]|nr:ParB N-terminal domain-containing protein [Gammaproteobacteria bacterium]
MIKPELKNIPIEFLKPVKYQTRRVFNSKALEELADSIKSEGLIQPIEDIGRITSALNLVENLKAKAAKYHSPTKSGDKTPVLLAVENLAPKEEQLRNILVKLNARQLELEVKQEEMQYS